MNPFQIIFLSVVQGITEWLPISSSGHLLLFEKWLQIKEADLNFDVWLHLASLVVIIYFFRREIKEVIVSPFKKEGIDNPKKNWWRYIVLSSFFTALLGFIFYKQMDLWRNLAAVSTWWLVTAVLLLATKFAKSKKSIGWQEAVILGLVQGLAVLPGLSRSGVVIAVALLLGLRKDEAFSYAFLVAIPAILGAWLLSFQGFVFSWLILLAFVITMIVSYLTLKLLRLIIKRDYFYLFFIYLLILGVVIKIII
jgi:undecaprenyl-diphosphatase